MSRSVSEYFCCPIYGRTSGRFRWWSSSKIEGFESTGTEDDDYPFCADIVRMEEILVKEKRAAERAETRRKRRDAGEASDGSESPTSSEDWM